MKCVVHLDIDLIPKEFESPEEAIEFVEKYMNNVPLDAGDARLAVRWRRDDLYPNNYCEYTKEQLLAEITANGEVTLQLAGVVGDDIVAGEIATIITAERDRKEVAEADAELEKLSAELKGSGMSIRRPISASSKPRKRKRKK